MWNVKTSSSLSYFIWVVLIGTRGTIYVYSWSSPPVDFISNEVKLVDIIHSENLKFINGLNQLGF